MFCQIRADQYGETIDFRKAVAGFVVDALKARGLEKVAPYYQPNWFWRRTEDVEDSIKQTKGDFKVAQLELCEKLRMHL